MNKKTTIFLLVFFLSFSVYLKTLTPTISLGDSGEFVSGVYRLGILHPTSFPLFFLLGKIFTLLPLGEIAFRVNLGSGTICGGLLIALFYLALSRHFKNTLSPIFTVFIFAFTSVIWQLTAGTEVYCLFLLLLVVIFYCWSFPDKNIQKLLVFLSALSFGLHPFLAIALLPALFYLLFKKQRGGFYLPFLFTLVFFLYLILPIRGARTSFLNWLHPENISGFLSTILAKPYRQFLASEISVFYQRSIFYLITFARQFAFLGILIALLSLGKKETWGKSYNWLVIPILIINSLTLLTNTALPVANPDFLAYMGPPILASFFWFHEGIYFLKNLACQKNRSCVRSLKYLGIICILLWGGINYLQNNKRNNYLLYDYARNVLQTIDKPGAQLNTSGDSFSFSILYVTSLGNRPDIILNLGAWGIIEGEERAESFPFQYETFFYSIEKNTLFFKNQRLAGLLFQNKPGSNPVRYYRNRGHNLKIANDRYSRWLLTYYYLNLLDYYQEQQKPVLVKYCQKQVETFTYDDMWEGIYVIAKDYVQIGRAEKAGYLLELVIRLKPDFDEAYNSLGLIKYEKKEYPEAATLFLKALDLSPDFHIARFNLAINWEAMGESAKARIAWQEYLEQAQNDPQEAPGLKIAQQHLKTAL